MKGKEIMYALSFNNLLKLSAYIISYLSDHLPLTVALMCKVVPIPNSWMGDRRSRQRVNLVIYIPLIGKRDQNGIISAFRG